ncbi:MAG: hypothetical protein EBZ69_01450 [Alphaproteobacteria bacterium]|nr:hypothetical protein [Alphaproteobacteria bacterium]
MDYSGRLVVEALIVGATLTPVVMFAESRFENRMIAITIAGASYHLIAEFSGLNSWYLKHGAAALLQVQEVHAQASAETAKTSTHRLV